MLQESLVSEERREDNQDRLSQAIRESAVFFQLHEHLSFHIDYAYKYFNYFFATILVPTKNFHAW